MPQPGGFITRSTVHSFNAVRGLYRTLAVLVSWGVTASCSTLDFNVSSLPLAGADGAVVRHDSSVVDNPAGDTAWPTDRGAVTVADVGMGTADVRCTGCRGNEDCVMGRCVSACGSWRERCDDGVCADLRSDSRHCGRCEIACDHNRRCCRGVCRDECD